MRTAPRTIRAAVTWVALTAALLSAALIQPTSANAADKTYTVAATTDVRATAASSATVLGQVAKGVHVRAKGSVAGGWLPISYAASTGYVLATKVTADKSVAGVVATGPAGKRTPEVNVNVRKTASLDAPIVDLIPKASEIKVTGITSGDFTQITNDGTTAWIYSRFLAGKTDTTPDIVAEFTTTTDLALRVTASATAKNQGTIKTGKRLGITGTHSGTYSQAVYGGKVGWVITGYLKAVAGTPAELKLPLRKATRYVVAAGAILRASADAESAKIITLPAATALRTTGTTKSGFTEIIWDGGTKWVATASIASSKPSTTDPTDLGSSSLNKLEPYGKAAVLDIRPHFPKIKTIHGWRSSSSYSSDHPNGRAIDIMIPDYKNNKALGDAVASYVIANADRLHVTYLIWRQRSYRITRGYWTKMEDRGGDTANHMDHVHVSFEKS